MSTDPEGILYYGIDLSAAVREEFWTADFDYNAMNEAWDKAHEPTRPTTENYHTPEWDAWRVELKAYEASSECVEMAWFGAEGCEVYVVHGRSLKQSVAWGEQIDLGFPTLAQQPDADEWIRKFCEQFKIPYKQPTWHLAARYF